MDENKAAAPEEAVALEMPASVTAPEVNPAGTPEALLAGISAALKASDDVDAELAAVLSDHLLTVAPHANVIANAKAAILALAARRAAPAKE